MSEISNWFENLVLVQKRMFDLNGGTSQNLYDFSKQQLGLLPTQDLQDNLCHYCQTKQLGYCSEETFKDLTKNFRWFVDDISTRIKEILLKTAYGIAENKCVPPYNDIFPRFRRAKVADVCSSTTNQAIMTGNLFPDILKEFYVNKGDMVANAVQKASTFEQFCEDILA